MKHRLVAVIVLGQICMHGTAAVVAAFQAMIRKKSLADLEPWLECARSSLVAAFANGFAKDRAAVSAAISSPWLYGQTEW